MRRYRLSGLFVALLLIAASAVAFRPWGGDRADLRLVVDISASELYVVVDGETVETYPISAGTDEHPTPRGDFTIEKVIWNPAWVPPPNAAWAEGETRQEPGAEDNPMKTAKVFFKEPDYYLHGTDKLDELGDPASHGCIRMRPWHIAEVAKKVMEYGGESRPQSWYNARINGNETVEVTVPDAIPITIRA